MANDRRQSHGAKHAARPSGRKSAPRDGRGNVPAHSNVVYRGGFSAAGEGESEGEAQLKVYVLTQGCYSDYSIVGVFSSREKVREYWAHRYSESESPLDENDIEEWSIDEWLAASWHDVWYARLNLYDGRGDAYFKADDKAPASGQEFDVPQNSVEVVTFNYGQATRWIYAKSVVSAQHAQKLAVEGRQAWLRDKTSVVVRGEEN